MNPQSAAIAGSGNPLKSRFESEIRGKYFQNPPTCWPIQPPQSSIRFRSSIFSRSSFAPKPIGKHLLRRLWFRIQNFPGFRIRKATISQISEFGFSYMKWNMSTDSSIQSFKPEKYRLMKNYAFLPYVFHQYLNFLLRVTYFFLKNYRFRLWRQNRNYKKDRNYFSSFTKFKCIY